MQPFVSIAVISYNNINYIEECIKSCLNQDYSKYQIVISDDGSNDGTAEVIKKYSKLNPEIIKIILSEKNEGVTKNFNKVCTYCDGDWIKIIASDDKLKDDCLSLYVQEIINNKIESGIIFADLKMIGINQSGKIATPYVPFFSLNKIEKINFLEKRNCLTAPTAFFSKETLQKLGFADERYPQMEDYPLWIKAVKNDISLYYINKTTVEYRIHDSLSFSIKRIGDLEYYKSLRKFYIDQIWPNRRGIYILKNIEDYIFINKTILSIRLFNNKKNIAYYMLDFILYPLRLYTISSGIKNILKQVNSNKHI